MHSRPRPAACFARATRARPRARPARRFHIRPSPPRSERSGKPAFAAQEKKKSSRHAPDVQTDHERHRHSEQRSAHRRRDRRRNGGCDQRKRDHRADRRRPTGFVPRNRFALASAAASPVHRPAPTERAMRCAALIGIAPVSALMLKMIAAARNDGSDEVEHDILPYVYSHLLR